MLAEHPAVDVGIHLALSSEWENVKWRPVSEAASLRDADGYFYPMIFPNKNYPKRSLQENGWRLEDVEKEFRAQIELGKKRLPRVSHLSGHMGCDRLQADVRALSRKLAKEYQLDIHPEELDVRGVGYVGKHATSAEKLDGFLKMLDGLEPGNDSDSFPRLRVGLVCGVIGPLNERCASGRFAAGFACGSCLTCGCPRATQPVIIPAWKPPSSTGCGSDSPRTPACAWGRETMRPCCSFARAGSAW
jgi:hypothetical protein